MLSAASWRLNLPDKQDFELLSGKLCGYSPAGADLVEIQGRVADISVEAQVIARVGC